MNKETLKTLRIVIPGIIIFLSFLPLFLPNLNPETITSAISKLEQGLLYLVLVTTFGSLYYISGLRGHFLRKSLDQVNENIKEKLLSPFYHDKVILKSSQRIREGNILLQIFYNLIDNDESLKEKAKSVYLNGLILSSLADLLAVSTIATWIYLLAYFILQRPHYLYLSFTFGVIHIITSIILLPLVTKKHINLSNDQLEFILVHHRKPLFTKLKELAK